MRYMAVTDNIISYTNPELDESLQRYGITPRLFADDVEVYLENSARDDTIRLQKVLVVIATPASKWQLTVSISKRTLNVGSSCCKADYYINGTELPQCATCRDHGVKLHLIYVVEIDLSPIRSTGEGLLKAYRSPIYHPLMSLLYLRRCQIVGESIDSAYAVDFGIVSLFGRRV